ncbi:MAG: hemerythrin domain-containing protein [Kofleriaceae bacterium]
MVRPLVDPDPVASLVHDHSSINRQLLELGRHMEALRAETAQASPPIIAVLQQLREELFLHFAREEEGLFPFVASEFPDFSWQVQSMAAAHDGICGGLSRLLHMLITNSDSSTILAVFDRFTKAYGDHSRAEAQLLASIDAAVTPEQRAALAALVDGL